MRSGSLLISGLGFIALFLAALEAVTTHSIVFIALLICIVIGLLFSAAAPLLKRASKDKK